MQTRRHRPDHIDDRRDVFHGGRLVKSRAAIEHSRFLRPSDLPGANGTTLPPTRDGPAKHPSPRATYARVLSSEFPGTRAKDHRRETLDRPPSQSMGPHRSPFHTFSGDGPLAREGPFWPHPAGCPLTMAQSWLQAADLARAARHGGRERNASFNRGLHHVRIHPR